MAKKFSRRKLNLRKVTAQRNQSLKINSPVTGRIVSLQEKNRDLLNKLTAEA